MQRSKSPGQGTSGAVLALAAITAILALIAAVTGLYSEGGPGKHTVTSLRGEDVEIFGEGIYRYDTTFIGAGNYGTDTAVLVLGIPVLLVTAFFYWRGSLRGGLLLIATLSYFLYVYSSYALGTTAYNDLFLVYVALFASSSYALARLYYDTNSELLGSRFSEGMPRRGPAWLMFIGSVVLLIVWGLPAVMAFITDELPKNLDTYTTLVTYALDLAILAPATFIAWWLILNRQALGYLIAIALLGILVFLGPSIALQTIFQLDAGVEFEPGEIIGPMAGFGVVTIAAIWFLYDIVRHIVDTGPTAP